VGVVLAEAVDDDVVVVLTFGVDVFVVVESHADVGDLLRAEENQVAFVYAGALDFVAEEVVLLVGIAGNDVTAHAVAELHKTTAIYAFVAGAAPQVGDIEE